MPMLYLKCKTCGVEFASSIVMDEISFATSELINNRHNCPRGHVKTYNKEDYHFKQ